MNGTSVPCGRAVHCCPPTSTARIDLPGLDLTCQGRSQWCSAGWPGWPVARRARVEKPTKPVDKNKNCGCILCCQCAESAAAQQPLMRLPGSTAIYQPVNMSKSENMEGQPAAACSERQAQQEVAEEERHRDGSTQPFILVPFPLKNRREQLSGYAYIIQCCLCVYGI
ncbi:hypothetical protein GE21DRAFT_4170 [Neurospora crassa]|uniref:Uncharacterized protein n=1 Tax=Neurospora crassa (strain ATCC 24698 / 74-OR23-1A / CBS 708.71 / DSM 1257 / FGSC 987) TaxID=367110 RepID=Q7SBH6_NEUCR|nr:hypothetical protein NCU06197 [Neurospora crassa OR74A]EAA33773.3 hypothetical protein NCU06197 [Neurospora crassa OR74A]KHE87020.1 hypothetical protein GE21DRAFT_4170 [Neurospora crassa]|eukprot:XP_963009.3 hypothetical protein NCU06197 [Neurospora crassa OR74A]